MKKTFHRQHQEQKENAFSNNLKLTFSILQLTEYQQGAVLTTEMRVCEILVSMEKNIQSLKDRMKDVPPIEGDEDFFPSDST